MSQPLKKPIASKTINIPNKDDKKFEIFRSKLVSNIKYKDLLFSASDQVSTLFLNADKEPIQTKKVETFVDIELYDYNNPYERRKDYHGPFPGPTPDNHKKDFKGPFPGPT